AYASHADRRLQDLGEVLLELGSALLLPEQPRELLAESNDYGRAIDRERLGLRELRGFADASLLRAFDELAPGFADRLQLHDRRSRANRDRRLGHAPAPRDGDDRSARRVASRLGTRRRRRPAPRPGRTAPLHP